jgi:hypothetical protein
MDQSVLYRSLLRVSLVVTAAVLTFQAGLIDERTSELFSQTTHHLSAAVGMSVSVAPTEFNEITAELTKQQNLLAQREDQIAAREIDLGLNSGEPTAGQTTTYVLASILFVQLLLIILNYGLDYLRVREQKYSVVTKELSRT